MDLYKNKIFLKAFRKFAKTKLGLLFQIVYFCRTYLDFMQQLTLIIKTLYGMEEVLREELEELGYGEVKMLNRAVEIQGSWKDVYFLNLHLRCALAVLVKVKEFWIKEEKDLYKQAMKINWTDYFDVDKSFAVKGAVFSQVFSHSQYPYLLVKDAIVDTFREACGERPDVSVKNPQVLFDLHIKEKEVTISLNTSGLPLYMRGYRQETGTAPLNEVLAAGMIRMSKWDRKTPFVDPFCGSGTLLIEAAFLATGIPSCIERQHFAFKNFKSFDEEVWEELQTNVRRKIRNWTPEQLGFKLIGSDLSEQMVLKTKRNLRGLPIARLISLSVGSFEELKLDQEKPGILLSNPPYGKRLGSGERDEEIEELYGRLGDWFKQELSGFNCWIISSNLDALKCIGLKPSTKIKLFNGDLECSFRKFEMFSGSNREFKTRQNQSS
ncbi:MAG: class I SAM-dependent RNA methyltransferase [Bacteroidetes bacterium]|nr:MAG: class I SAM-dependent RNA methyltransferase [Bacteroidota bacterium]